MKRYDLNFRGYWRDEKREGLPAVCGIYLVYRCVYNQETNTVRLVELIYIGQATNVCERIKNHEKMKDFLHECQEGETLCYSVAEVDEKDLNVVEGALIFAQQPKLNETHKDDFNYEPVELHLEGRCNLMRHLDFEISK